MEASQPQDAEQHENPDEGAGPAVEPTEGSQGEQLPEVEGGAEANRISSPPPAAQSGVPPLPENEGVEPQPEYAGPVGDSGQAPGGPHGEASEVDSESSGALEGEGGSPEGENPAE